MNKDALRTAMACFILAIERQRQSTREANDRPLYQTFLAHTAVLAAKVEHNLPLHNDVKELDRLFGHTWFKDVDAYTCIYAEWDIFKDLLDRSIHGMTVNERLFNLGLVEEFDHAVTRRDEPRVRAILFKCCIDEDSTEAIINKYFKT